MYNPIKALNKGAGSATRQIATPAINSTERCAREFTHASRTLTPAARKGRNLPQLATLKP